MTQIEDEDSESAAEGPLKKILTWGSVAYACGFITVLLHTWKLGLPVVELIKPIYVWIGLPIAMVAFFWERILLHFRTQGSMLAAEFRRSLIALSDEIKPKEIDLVAEWLGIFATIPGIWLFRPLLRRFVQNDLGPVVEVIRNKVVPVEYEPKVRRFFHLFHRVAGVLGVLSAIFSALNLVGNIMGILLALYVYVWIIYPIIPQSLGGGQPTRVQIVVDGEALPAELRIQGLAAENRSLFSPSARVLSADLLYMTNELFFIELGSAARLSIKAEAVRAVLWNPTT